MEDAKQLLTELHAVGYRNFSRAPRWQAARQIGSTPHHGKFLDVYVNDVLASAIGGGEHAPWPIGSLVVKDGWDDATGIQFFQTAVLRKDGEKDWFGAEYSANGEVLETGHNFDECNGCHKGGTDYLLSF